MSTLRGAIIRMKNGDSWRVLEGSKMFYVLHAIKAAGSTSTGRCVAGFRHTLAWVERIQSSGGTDRE